MAAVGTGGYDHAYPVFSEQDYGCVGVQHVQPFAAATNSGEAFLMEMLSAMDRHMQQLRETQQALVGTVELACRRALEHNFGRLVLVGSAALRVETPGSDVDVVCFTQHDQTCPEAACLPVDNLRKVHYALWNMVNNVQSSDGQPPPPITMELIDDARVPILRVLWGYSGSQGSHVAVDVSIDQTRPVEHIRWFQRVGAAPSPHAPQPVVAPLVTLTLRCVKWWLRQRQIPRTKEGGLPTIAWLLMAVHVCSLPSIHEQAKVIRSRPMGALLALLMAFFRHYTAPQGLDGVLSFSPDGSSSQFRQHERPVPSTSVAKAPLSPSSSSTASTAAPQAAVSDASSETSPTDSMRSVSSAASCASSFESTPAGSNISNSGPPAGAAYLGAFHPPSTAHSTMWSDLSILDPTTAVEGGQQHHYLHLPGIHGSPGNHNAQYDLAPRLPPATQVLLAYELQRANERLQQVTLHNVETNFGASRRLLEELFEVIPEGVNVLPSHVGAGITALVLWSEDAGSPSSVEVGFIERVRPRAGWTAPFLLRTDQHSEVRVRHFYNVEERTGRCHIRDVRRSLTSASQTSLILCPSQFICCAGMERDGHYMRLDPEGYARYTAMRRYVASLRLRAAATAAATGGPVVAAGAAAPPPKAEKVAAGAEKSEATVQLGEAASSLNLKGAATAPTEEVAEATPLVQSNSQQQGTGGAVKQQQEKQVLVRDPEVTPEDKENIATAN
eukprot:CAMPEP_0178404112 /NCGR_PEP_ID=MMETSP0689_2-20121128/17712_1 /TAXON_ID=160604 /ORGANISM="Amphidinium massartii, Strain CS-259" /LENGTH=726 /DNA_ID=CAMNT_0020025079 /DNA_START=10 /DNA_END=2190 /DNA_ORIENTATION=+